MARKTQDKQHPKHDDERFVIGAGCAEHFLEARKRPSLSCVYFM